MRLIHNKKRNTAFVYEALIRELTESVVKNNKNKQNKIISIMKDHFSSRSILREELDFYKSIYETKQIEKNLAEKIVDEAKAGYLSLDRKKVFMEQSNLINKINKTLSNKVFRNFVPNYKSLASVYSIFNEKLLPKDRVLLEDKIINEMSSSSSPLREAEQKPIDNIIYNSFVKNYNEEYSEHLNESQKSLLSKYVASFSDNGLELKVYINEEIYKLKNKLNEFKNDDIIKEDHVLEEQVNNVLSLFEEYKEKKVDDDLVEVVLKVQDLVHHMEVEQ